MNAQVPAEMRRTHFKAHDSVCPVCGATFLKTRFWKEFCSSKCRKAFHKNAQRVGVDFSVRKAFEQITADLTAIKSQLGIKGE